MTFVPVERDEVPAPCVTLVGMAGAGKSTLGALLSKKLGWGQLDTDRYMESFYGMPLQTIMDTYGFEDFLRIEEKLVSGLSLTRTVISTGGSVIYGPRAVARLKELGPMVLLDIEEDTFLKRVGNGANRGLAVRAGSTLLDVYYERQPLYRAAADVTISTNECTPDECVENILQQLDF